MTFTWFIGYIEIIARPFFISDPLSAIGPYFSQRAGRIEDW